MGLYRFLKPSFKNSREVELNLDVKIPLDGFFIQLILLQVFVCHLIYQGQIHFGILLANIYWPNSSQRVWKCDGMHLQAWINQWFKIGKKLSSKLLNPGNVVPSLVMKARTGSFGCIYTTHLVRSMAVPMYDANWVVLATQAFYFSCPNINGFLMLT